MTGELGDTEPAGRGEATARSAGMVLLLAAVAVLATAVAAVVVLVGRGGSSAPPGRLVERLGPDPGRVVADYLDDIDGSPAALEGPVVGLVHLAAYLSADDADQLAQDADVDAIRYLVALPGSPPVVVEDIGAGIDELVADAASQIAEIEPLIPTVEDPEFAEFYRQEVRRYRSIRDGAAVPSVFGLVVTGRASALRALAASPQVRAVEARAGLGLAPDALIDGLRPEERVRTGTPEFRRS